ncbi:MAG: SprB repeat-containing protein [Saprospiraceae bacterium]|nr:SprB repeat-containing protein [Saprospiraceae bacterium]
MRFYYTNIFIVSILLLFSAQQTNACGYDWVGECSSSVHLRINGTLDSFAIVDCPSGIRFNSLHLGTLQNLSLANARAITWESCTNNVSAVGLHYRVYEQGGAGGNFQILNLEQDYFTLVGLYTTRYRSKASNIDLTAGLTIGETYTLEIYLVADIDTIGDDFIPETTMTKNNGGENYRMTFTYGGPTATPFVVIPTLVKEPNCHGENNGAISVSVWGEQTGLIYNWSNINLNFFQQNNLPAGTYTVTVIGANYTESDTIVLGQPDSLTVQIINIQPVTCGGGLGALTVQASGGTAPYHYLWANGQTAATATFPNSGNYALTITDAHNCFVVQTINLPGGNTIQQNIAAEICLDDSIVVGGSMFDEPGVYSILVSGTAGCDTLITLILNEIDPGALLANLPDHILVTCSTPSVNLCAELSSDAAFQWSKDGIPATATPCLLATAGGVYTLQVMMLQGCVATKSILSEEHLVPQPAQFVGLDTLTCNGFGTTPTLFRVITNAQSPTFLWTSNGQFLTSNDSCWFVISDGSFGYILPELTVTDIFGCISQAVGTLSIKVFTDVPSVLISSNNSSGPNNPDGSASVQISGGGPYEINWSTGQTGPEIQNLLPGTYCATVTQVSNGCMSSDCAMVGYTVGSDEKYNLPVRLSPNPVVSGDWLEIALPEKFAGSKCVLELLDRQGSTIKTEVLGNTSTNLRFQIPEYLPPGGYFLRLTSEKYQAIEKILLKN